MNYYETLGIQQKADPSEIKRAYYAAVKKHSPDKDPEKFKEIRAAYEILSKPARREDYDKLFQYDVTDQVRQELLTTRDLLANHRYKEIVLRLTENKKPRYDNSELNLMLAKAYLGMGKSGTADALAKKILENEPDNADAIILLTSACNSKGHYKKADEYFMQWLDRNPNSPTIWNEYLEHVSRNFPLHLPSEVSRAFDINKANLQECYHLFLIGCGKAIKEDQQDRAIEFLEEFVKCFKDDKELNKIKYETALHVFVDLVNARFLRPLIADALPVLQHNKNIQEARDEELSLLGAYAEWVAMSKDERVHEVFHDFTELLIDFDGSESCKNERGSMELYIIDNLDNLRPSVLAIKKDYPKLYNLDPKFFGDVLDIRKTDAILNRGARTYRQMAKSGAFDDLEDFPVEKPYVRETPKVGRNDPCPCGSGKKFKRCCG